MNDSAFLRKEFIGMVFALAIAQVGIELGLFFVSGLRITAYPYFLTHLVLATFIITTSWVGWFNSTTSGSKEQLKSSFSRSYFTLLLDLGLVFFYFILVESVEKPHIEENTPPDALSEIYWSQWIFGVYIIWDLVTKLVHVQNRENLELSFRINDWFKRSFQAILCYLLILFIVKPMSEQEIDNNLVVLIDLSLLFVFLIFRGLKQIEANSKGNKRAKTIRVLFYWIMPITLFVITQVIYIYMYD